ncbi:MAG: DSD1 family PLP-dependent enzyme [Planctomycetaceae bacterium]|nr:alanine racemase [Planctomycetaceae bacterium]
MYKQFINPTELPADHTLTKADLDTPFLAVDLDKMDANVARISQGTKDFNVQWRPHCKGHKSSIIASRLVKAGAIGATCAKLAEAEVMVRGGVPDVLIANLIVGQAKLARLAMLCKEGSPIVCIDHLDQANPMNEMMVREGVRCRVIIEVNIGLDRVGCSPDKTLELARELHTLPGLKFAGIMGYEGHLLTIEDQVEKREKIEEALQLLAENAAQLQAEGIPCEIVSCGGTGSYLLSRMQNGITELQAGGGMFMDQFYEQQCQVTGMEKALTIVATVVGRPAVDRAIIDSGKKTLHVEYEPAVVVGRDDMKVARLSAEHGELELSGDAQNLRIGDRLELVPGYADMTCVLHDYFYVFQNDTLVDIWPLEARGLLQ